MGWIDIALIAVLGLSVLVGLFRGFLYEVLSLLGWVVAYFAAQWLSPVVAPSLPVGTPGSALNAGAAFACSFVVVLLGWGVLSWLIQKLVQASPLSVADRLLGAVFGLARGVLVGLVAVTLAGMTPLAKTDAWRVSHGVALLQAGLTVLKPVLPDEVVRHLPA